eukprot:1169724-Prymnesium_polylepis.5
MSTSPVPEGPRKRLPPPPVVYLGCWYGPVRLQRQPCASALTPTGGGAAIQEGADCRGRRRRRASGRCECAAGAAHTEGRPSRVLSCSARQHHTRLALLSTLWSTVLKCCTPNRGSTMFAMTHQRA